MRAQKTTIGVNLQESTFLYKYLKYFKAYSLNISLQVHLWYIDFLATAQLFEGVECSEKATHYHKCVNPVPKRSEKHRPVSFKELNSTTI